MKLIVLGCWGEFPQAGGATSGYLVDTEEGYILLESGSGVFSQLAFYCPPEKIHAVILSHLHDDHIADVHILQYAIRNAVRRGLRKNTAIPLYLPNETPNSFIRSLEPEFTCIQVNSENVYSIAGSKVTFMPTSHTISCNAVRIVRDEKVIAYSADSAMDESLSKLAMDADLFLCESTMIPGSSYSSGDGHMGPEDAAQIAKKAKAHKLVLTHLPSDGDLLKARELARSIFRGPVELANLKAIYHIK